MTTQKGRCRRFQVVEYSSGYALRDRETGREHWLSDGVDVLFTESGKAMSPGTERFRRLWQATFNANPEETAEAYGFDRVVNEERSG